MGRLNTSEKEKKRTLSLYIRLMQPDDVSRGLRLSAAESWNQTEKDWKFFIENSGNISLAAEADGKVIGTTTAITYESKETWIGMVLVDKEYRGLGISKALLSDIFGRVVSHKSIKLDATPAGQLVYKKFGFRDEYPIARMTNLSLKNVSAAESDVVAEPIQSEDIEDVIAFDEIVFGADRRQLIEYLQNEYPHKGWLLKRNGKIEGFVLGRDGSRYHHIGPLAALNTIDARTLLSKAMHNLVNKPVLVDVLCDKEELIHWLNETGFVKQRHFIRMYKEVNPFPGATNKQFLICGPEFG